MFFKYDILKQESPNSTRWIAAVRYIDHAQKIIAEQMRTNRCAYVIVDAESGVKHLVHPRTSPGISRQPRPVRVEKHVRRAANPSHT
jgi:hypothetical protein